jgi:hypothetical protein
MQAQEPYSLSMRRSECAYCKVYAAHHATIVHLFGIICCAEHLPLARRDCNAWLHRARQVRLSDAREHPALRHFFQALPATFSAVRSNGDVDPGWFLPESTDRLLCLNSAGAWSVPIQKLVGGGDDRIERGAAFSSFLVAGVPGITPELVADAVAALSDGLYKADADLK